MHNNENSKRHPNSFVLIAGVATLLGLCGLFFSMGWNAGQQAVEPQYAVAAATDPVENDTALDEEALVELLAGSVNATAFFMPEYGLDPLDGCELEADSVYHVALSLPSESLSVVSRHNVEEFMDNNITAQVYYPSNVKAGDTGRMVILLNVNGQRMVSICDFVAKADLTLINGDKTARYTSSGGDVHFNNGRLKLCFYTGADDSFNHPQQVVLSGINYVRCNFHAY